MTKFTQILIVKSIIKEIYKVELCNECQKNKMFLLCNFLKTVQ